MLEFIRNQYIFNKCQVIILDDYGIISLSDHHLFEVALNKPIEQVHPFFETIRQLLATKNEEHVFHCIHLEIGNIIGNYNIIFNSGGSDQNPFVVLYDFTENCHYIQTIVQRRNESVIALEFEQIRAKQLISEKAFRNKLIATISHDLRTPLTAIAGYTELLQQKFSSNPLNELKTIEKSVQVIKDILDGLMGLAQLEGGVLPTELNVLDLQDITTYLQAIYSQKMQDKKLDFYIKKSSYPQHFLVDTTKVLQILINLIDNAYKFTNEGSVHVFLTQLLDEPTKPILQITVADTGIGFPAEAAEKIASFHKFHTTHIEGSGLGLSIVQGIIKLLNGQLSLQSQPNKGTTIVVQLPLVPKLIDNKPVTEQTIAFSAPLNVIVADDNEINLLLFKQLIEQVTNVFVTTVTDGNYVLDELQKNNFDAVFLDVNMDGLDGFTTAKLIKSNKLTKHIPIVAFTAANTPEEINLLEKAGMDLLLAKPFTKLQLLQILQKIALANK